ncbi:glycosyltransferase [Flavobacterium sp. LC2016-01]|uniref:glycosyltransferase n=1 Tax=Flavobacterium sp. LC2016-01 TaxID=2675876 RepID=UPI0012BB1059|nr:glycosyltransferase [Flavobacterium sp. LC2016-01]MTH18081.1 glycosyltransferase [Flavobacterium sp. LC2016-01]
MNKNKLAIVIPAYKEIYLEEALESISSQTCKNFTVYIGDDHSPYDLFSIIEKFSDKININYFQFEKNLGGTDLVKQWERCIELTNDEEWIWLFSDDDVMEKNCVENFYKTLQTDTESDLFHFDVKVINNSGKILEASNQFPQKLGIEEFLIKRLNYQLHSFVVEYIFKKKVYYENFKFQNFDLAWCSDDATWVKFGLNKGITTISNAFVLWRYSEINISSNLKDEMIILRKLESAIQYITWLRSFNFKNYNNKNNDLRKIKWILGSINKASSFSFNFKIKVYVKVWKKMNNGFSFKVLSWMLLSLCRTELESILRKNK